MVEQADQDNVGGWLQSLPDQQLQEVRRAATREIRRRGLRSSGEKTGNRKAAKASKRAAKRGATAPADE